MKKLLLSLTLLLSGSELFSMEADVDRNTSALITDKQKNYLEKVQKMSAAELKSELYEALGSSCSENLWYSQKRAKVACLLQAGLDPNEIAGSHRVSLFTLGLMFGDTLFLDTLVTKGIQKEKKDSDGYTPFHRAVQSLVDISSKVETYPEMSARITLAQKYGVDPMALSKSGDTILHTFVKKSTFHMMDFSKNGWCLLFGTLIKLNPALILIKNSEGKIIYQTLESKLENCSEIRHKAAITSAMAKTEQVTKKEEMKSKRKKLMEEIEEIDEKIRESEIAD